MVSPIALLSKKRKHYLTVNFMGEQDKHQTAVFELGKDIVRVTLSSPEARTGRKIEYQEEKYEAGRLFSCFDHSADDGQIDGGQEEPGRVVDEGVLPEFNLLLALGDHGDARLVCRGQKFSAVVYWDHESS